jgi:hypothetical protein
MKQSVAKALLIKIHLKGHSHEKVVKIIASNDRFGPTKVRQLFLNFLKSFLKKLRLFMWGHSRCKKGFT